ncbi:MAG TPA: alpha/beta family hydrolase [Gammaproteobacteria bacterium]
MKQSARHAERVEIGGPAGTLEALVETPREPIGAVAVVCHPHPLHGGTMQNKVVYTLARTFTRLGIEAVRFNFRGVGESAGRYAEGVGERDDAIAAAEWALRRAPGAPLHLAGFSFGAAVAAQISTQLRPASLVTVGLPVARLSGEFTPPDCPWLIAHGERDELIPLSEVLAWRDARAPESRLAVVPGATHFFHGKLNPLAQAVEAFVLSASEAGSSPNEGVAARNGRPC